MNFVVLCVMQTPVDVLGVILSLGTLGSVKKKSDNTDLQRRDVTLADKR